MQRRAFTLQLAAGPATEGPDPARDWPAAMAGLAMPLLAAGGEHDKPDFHAAARALADGAPRAAEAVIEDSGHLAPLENPEGFRSRLLAFLDRVAAPPAGTS
jgi:pimeloyl-ACP methyl ester carboxylesterase